MSDLNLFPDEKETFGFDDNGVYDFKEMDFIRGYRKKVRVITKRKPRKCKRPNIWEFKIYYLLQDFATKGYVLNQIGEYFRTKLFKNEIERSLYIDICKSCLTSEEIWLLKFDPKVINEIFIKRKVENCEIDTLFKETYVINENIKSETKKEFETLDRILKLGIVPAIKNENIEKYYGKNHGFKDVPFVNISCECHLRNSIKNHVEKFSTLLIKWKQLDLSIITKKYVDSLINFIKSSKIIINDKVNMKYKLLELSFGKIINNVNLIGDQFKIFNEQVTSKLDVLSKEISIIESTQSMLLKNLEIKICKEKVNPLMLKLKKNGDDFIENLKSKKIKIENYNRLEGLEKKLNNISSVIICCICKGKRISHYIDCGHCFCYTCIIRVKFEDKEEDYDNEVESKCPLCKKQINNIRKLHLSN